VRRNRAALLNALGYAIELKLLDQPDQASEVAGTQGCLGSRQARRRQPPPGAPLEAVRAAEASNTRAEGESRRVPCPPLLTKLSLRARCCAWRRARRPAVPGCARSAFGHHHRRAWDQARRSGLSYEEYRSPPARRPYHLRHACLSTRLNGGIAPTQVAEWAGHGVGSCSASTPSASKAKTRSPSIGSSLLWVRHTDVPETLAHAERRVFSRGQAQCPARTSLNIAR